MDQKELDRILNDESDDLRSIIREVGERGVLQRSQDLDDFSALLLRKEFQDLVIGELYENYFLPDRHESDWQLLRELVAITTSERVRDFVMLSVAGGVIGNASFAVVTKLLRLIKHHLERAKLPAGSSEPFGLMQQDVTAVQEFFNRNPSARISEIEAATKVPRERLYPLLKLLGFSHYRKGENTCQWWLPGSVGYGAQ